MLNVALIDSGVHGTTHYFAQTPAVCYRIERIRDRWQPDFSADDLVVVPNGANHVALYEARGAIRTFLDRGGTLACFCGFFTPWIPGNQWVHDNRQPLKAVRYRARPDPLGLLEYWWAEHPDRPPVAHTDFSHPLFGGLSERQACWHHHGVYTRIPDGARVLQHTESGEVICWETQTYGGYLLAGTQDPIVEHGVQQFAHLDHFVDNLVIWLCGRRPTRGKMTIDPGAYSRPFRRTA